MSGLRFKVGDLVRIVRMSNTHAFHLIGRIGEIHLVGPFAAFEGFKIEGEWWGWDKPFDYVVDVGPSEYFIARDDDLAPIDPPAEPESLTRRTHLEEPATA